MKRKIEVRISDSYGELEEHWRNAVFYKAGSSDVAVIKIQGGGYKRAHCTPLVNVRDTDIYRLGFPEGEDTSVADEKPGKTAVSETPQDFQGSMVSAKGMSGGPAIDIAGRVLGLAINRENDPRFAAQSYTEFVRIEEAASLLPKSNDEPGCDTESGPGTAGDAIDISDRLKTFGADSTLLLEYPDRGVSIDEGDYVLDGRSMFLTAKKLIVRGRVVIGQRKPWSWRADNPISDFAAP